MYPDPSLKNKRRLLIVAIALISVIIVIIVLSLSQKNQGSQAVSSAAPPDDAITVATKYLEAREDAYGADQSSPTAWIGKVKPLVTTTWYSQLQPSTASSAGSTPADYDTAVTNGYHIVAHVSDCSWNSEVAQPTTASGIVSCSLADTTVTSSGTPLSAGNLPFGWSFTGQQPPALLRIVKQGGVWLVDNDLTGQGSS